MSQIHETSLGDPLTLQVLGLRRPCFRKNFPVMWDENELGGARQIFPDYPCMEQAARDFSLSQMLTLPTGFGTIYLGQTFAAIVFVRVTRPIYQVIFKIELGNGALVDTSAQPIPVMEPGHSRDFYVSHEAKDIGPHRLQCRVVYTEGGETRELRRKIDFDVSNPLMVKTRLHVHQPEDIVYLQLQATNMTAEPLHITRMALDPSPPFVLLSGDTPANAPAPPDLCAPPPQVWAPWATAALTPGQRASPSTTKGAPPPDASQTDGAPPELGTDDRLDPLLREMKLERSPNCVRPNEVRQYMFKLTSPSPVETQRATSVGRIEIVWHTTFGEPGHLQTNCLPKKPDVARPITASVTRLFDTRHVTLEEPFRAECQFNNHTGETMLLKLHYYFEPTCGIAVQGRSTKTIGEVPPQSSVTTVLDLLPLAPGMQKLSGISVLDLRHSATPVELPPLGEIMVHPPGDDTAPDGSCATPS
eukprot:gnl/Trimastix_PCT/3104.p1 GENE.gnl/Trimastix_PCT/3104~~gnl/Trimastix_PCT/3104.p1  ORF type:complete len:474 (-),score=117.83 gnl/Trimastix_PCT/3104:905-2326(-)